MSDLVIPSSPSDRQKLKQILRDMTDCMTRMDAERETIKELAEAAEESFEIPKKLINKLARTMHKSNLTEILSDTENLEFLYETLIATEQKEA
jgi:hypothetical protein